MYVSVDRIVRTVMSPWHIMAFSFFMRSRQRTREDGNLFTNYLIWHTGGREGERESERV